MVDFVDVYNYLQKSNDINDTFDIIQYVDENELSKSFYECRTLSHGSIIYNTKSFMDNILQSFQYDATKIWKQVACDIPRVPTFVQGEMIYSANHLKEKIIDNIEWTNIVPSLCTQAAFYLSFQLMHTLFTNIDNNTYVTNDGANRSVNINEMDAILECTYKIINISDGGISNHGTISVTMVIPLDTSMDGYMKWSL